MADKERIDRMADGMKPAHSALIATLDALPQSVQDALIADLLETAQTYTEAPDQDRQAMVAERLSEPRTFASNSEVAAVLSRFKHAAK